MSNNINNSEIKPLVANLLRLNIGEYLKTSDYDHLALEYDFDNLWESAQKRIRDRSNIVIIGYDSPGDYEEAMQIVLDALWDQDRKGFFAYLEITLQDYLRWKKGKVDLSKVISNLKELEMPESQVKELTEASSTNPQRILTTSTEKQPSFDQSIVKVDSKLCFIIMPFTEKLNPIYDSIIKPVIQDLKLKSLRADEIFSSKPIMDGVWENIKKAKFLIADLTERNANVFYELGLAHALNKDVILLTQDIDDVPFDLQHYRIIVYQDSISGASKLKETLKGFIQELEKDNKKK